MERSSVPAVFSNFILPTATFDMIAAGRADRAVVDVLQRTERSRRLLLLQHILTSCTRRPFLLGPLGGVGPTEALLDAIQDADPAAVESQLAYPLTGMWLAHTVRLLAGAVAGR